MQSQATTVWATWPFQPFAFPPAALPSAIPSAFPPAFPAAFSMFAPFDGKLLENWQKMMGLNADFTRSILEETQFDWTSCFVPQDPEELYARQWNNQMPLMSIPMHYASAMLELGVSTQRAWMDAWGHLLGMPALMPAMPWMPGAAAADAASDATADVAEDVPAAAVRETPRTRKSNSH